MNGFSWGRLRGPLKYVLGLGVLALLAGVAVYRNSPAGLPQYAQGDPCPSFAHSFASIYLTVVGAAGVLALVAAIACIIAYRLYIFDRIRTEIRAFAVSCSWSVAGLVLLALLAGPLKSFMPLSPGEPCKALIQPADKK
jgi:cytochrome bd-type quinol oxidase subunit 1